MAWEADPALVWQFYSMRRRDALAAEPNPAHLALAEMERRMGDRFYLCTQNVDDLHERGGSKRVQHMHGTLFQSRCVRCEKPFADTASYESEVPVCLECGAAVRPHIVWFGEMPMALDEIYAELEHATVLMVAGTSGNVYPAAGFVEVARRRGIRTVYVGPEKPANAGAFDEILIGEAGTVLPKMVAGDVES